ncbi:MAG: RNA polymerase sigma factor RpoH [Gammaproteobacteria bacterium]|nr:RNA polymerase sigma factor RpoH [Gammaproteobacteria bacterium]
MSTALTLGHPRLPVATGDLNSYIRTAYAMPMLSESEEHQLAVRLRDHGDIQAAQQLILAHLRFVIRIARDYTNYGLPVADLIQEGTVGLMRAVKRFDPELGVRLASYAVHWIRAEIYEYVLHNWRIVKVATTKAQRKLFFNLHRMKKRLGWFNRQQLEEVAQELGVKPEEVEEMEGRLAAHDQMFDPWSHAEDADEERSQSPLYLADMRDEPSQRAADAQQQQLEGKLLLDSLNRLDPRSQEIIRRRWIGEEKVTLRELAEEYGLSIERIRQIEATAFKKLRTQLAPLRH